MGRCRDGRNPSKGNPASDLVVDSVRMPVAMTNGNAIQAGSGRSRVTVALGIGLVAVGIGVIRRVLLGPTKSNPPSPPKIPHKMLFGKVDGVDVGDRDAAMDQLEEVTDDYFWMRDDSRKSKHVLKHLREENAYTNFMTLSQRRARKRIYNELLSHVQETDSAVPSPDGPYIYYIRTVQGSSYVFHCRKPILANGDYGEEKVLLDENLLARGKAHCSVSGVHVSPDHALLAYSVDFTGNEKYDIYFMDIASGTVFENEIIRDTAGFMEWGHDNGSVYYGTMDEAHRPYKVWRHLLRKVGSDSTSSANKEDECLYTETDEKFIAYCHKSLSNRFLFIESSASTSSEVRYIDLNAVSSFERIRVDRDIHLIAEREDDLLYSVCHPTGNRFFITTNRDGATNFKIMHCEIGDKGSDWKDLLPYEAERTMLGVLSFKTFSVISGREGGFSSLWLMQDHDPSRLSRIEFEEEACVLGLGSNLEYESRKVRVVYSSMVTPIQTWDIDVLTGERKLLKENPVPNYNRNLYKTERTEAVGRDGTKIPLTLTWNEEAIKDVQGTKFVHLYGYGSYQVSIDPQFMANILPLLDRGIIFAIAHIRGGGEKGRVWYEAARFETKQKTFDDFIACAEHLITSGRTSPEKLSIEGRSAGGLLMGAVLNMRPELFRAALAGVPFVDCLQTMGDASIPLTTGEWLEWGNPHQRKFFNAIRGYCPYQNVAKKPYPAILAVAGLHDPRVLYSEPAKWVAKLRDHTTSGREVLLKIDLNSGHFSASDRYKAMHERAFELAWLLKQIGAPMSKIAG